MSKENMGFSGKLEDEAGRKSDSLGKKNPKIRAVWAIFPFFIAIIAIVMVSFRSFSQIEATLDARSRTFGSIVRANAILASLSLAESGLNRFIVTGNDVFLESYRLARRGIDAQLPGLIGLDGNNMSGKRHELAPLIAEKLAELESFEDLRRNQGMQAVMTAMSEGQGQRLSASIVESVTGYIQDEEGILKQEEARLLTDKKNLFASILVASLLIVLLAVSFVVLIYRQLKNQFASNLHQETLRLLGVQETTNRQLEQVNGLLVDSEERLAVTLNSIGDGVIATDTEARVTRLNPVAERLTGWTQAEATGRSVNEIFHIVNQETMLPCVIPVMETLAKGTIQGLANHTILIARDGIERNIADSCAPINSRAGGVIGAVLIFRDVTNEYAIQDALRDNSARMFAVFNTVFDGIITMEASADVIDSVNQAAERIFGYDALELVGKSFETLIPEIDSGTINRFLERPKEGSKTLAMGIGREFSGRRKDGSFFPLEMTVSEMTLDGKRFFTGIMRDISLRKQTENALVKASALQNAIFKSANFSCIATDAKGIIQIFNVGAECMLGYAADDVVNTLAAVGIFDVREIAERAEYLSNEFNMPITSGFDALAFKASLSIEDIHELTCIRKDGTNMPMLVSVTALRDPQEAIIGYLLIGTDNTASNRRKRERMLIDKALMDKNVELQTAKLAAEKANLAKSDFLSSMSHELRTPLGAILGFTQLMASASPAPSPSQKRSIDQILKAGWYLLELINEILDLALIESGKLSLSMEPVSLAEILQECQNMIEPQAKKRKIAVSFVRMEVPWFVNADRTRLKQVLLNLLSNSIKYNVVSGTVTVDCTLTSPGLIRISIHDSGNGLSPEQISQLFQPFNRLGQDSKVTEGTGIGLVVCKRLIELMDGSISMQSTMGKGSVFWIEMPLQSKPKSQADEVELIPSMKESGKDAKPPRTLLYVEDNPANLMLVEDLLARRPDIKFLSAMDGNSGVDIARSFLPDIILMDINLPGISGLAALKILADDPSTARIPVIAISANAMPHDIARGLEAGFFRYLTKPIKIDNFMNAVDDALEFVMSESIREGGLKTP